MQIYKVGTQRGKERNRKEGRRGTMPSENSVLKRSAANINSCPTISKKWFRTKPDSVSKHLRHKDIHFDGTGKFWYHILGLLTIVWAPTSPSAASGSRKARLSPVASEAAPKYVKWIHNSLHGPLHSPCHGPHPVRALGSSCGRKLSLSWCLSCLAPCPAQQELRGFAELLGQLMDCEN